MTDNLHTPVQNLVHRGTHAIYLRAMCFLRFAMKKLETLMLLPCFETHVCPGLDLLLSNRQAAANPRNNPLDLRDQGLLQKCTGKFESDANLDSVSSSFRTRP